MHQLFLFLQLASSSLLRLGQETEKEVIRNRESVYLLLDQVIMNLFGVIYIRNWTEKLDVGSLNTFRPPPVGVSY